MARHYIETIMSDRAIELECNSFMSLCDVIDTLLSVKNKILSLADGSLAMRRSVRKYFEDHKLAYGSANFKPKTHWIFDVADQMADLASRGVDVMPDMFVIERLHQSAKNMSQHVKSRNGVQFSKSALQGMLLHQFGMVQKMSFEPQLKGVMKVGTTEFAKQVEVSGVVRTIGDVVRRGDALGSVAACFASGVDHSMVVDVLLTEVASKNFAAVGREPSGREIWRASEVSPVTAWCHAADDSYAVVL